MVNTSVLAEVFNIMTAQLMFHVILPAVQTPLIVNPLQGAAILW